MTRTALALISALTAAPALAQSDEVDVCISSVRAVLEVTTGVTGGTVLGSSFSEAGTLVYLEDGNGEVWKCVAYQDGSLGSLGRVFDPAEIEQARSAPQPPMAEAVQFASGASSAAIERSMEAGGALQFSLGAAAGQTLSVNVTPDGDAQMYFYVRSPDDGVLAEPVDGGMAIEAELPLDGEYIVEVVSQESAPASFTATFTID